jgi:hypothetical protein
MPRNLLSLLCAVIVAVACFPSAIRATERLRIEPGTKIPVRIEDSIGTKEFNRWKSFGPVRTVSGTLMQDLATSDGQVALPAGTKIHVAVLESKRAGRITGRSRLRLGLYSVRTPDGEVIPLDGYPTELNHRRVDKEGTAHGHRGLVKDSAVDVSSVAIGAGVGAAAGGPPGAAIGAGGGLLVAGIYTLRRGSDLIIPAGTVIEFVLGRPASFMATGEVVEDAARLHSSTWGRGQLVPPSEDLLALADQLDSDPDSVLQQLKHTKLKDRPQVDRTFAKYLQAVARYQTGDRSKDILSLIGEAFNDGQSLPLPPSALDEMARNYVRIARATEKDWQRDPLLNNPRVQAALVEEIQ